MILSVQFEVHQEGCNLILSDTEFRSRLSSILDVFKAREQEIFNMISGGGFGRYFKILHGPTTRTKHLVRLVFLEDDFRRDLAFSTDKPIFAHS